MRRALLEELVCPTCRCRYAVEADESSMQSLVRGSLSCASCGVIVPVEQGFPFFTLADIDRPEAAILSDDDGAYARYRENKRLRGEMEIYAAFHPFNEAVRAAESLLPMFAAKLKPGDLLLDPWARSGWTAAWLAERFPEQRVIALWEGDSSVLGYRGFAHWFAEGRRPDNLDVMFAHPDRGLPFADGSIAGVFSHDCLHRFGTDSFAAELLRVAAPEAPLIFAHVHLSNSQPDPWFDRGGTIRHGRSYRRWLDRITASGPRSARIVAEGDLFGNDNPIPLPDDPETHQYNGLIVLAESKLLEQLPPVLPPPVQSERPLLNPLFRLYPDRSAARRDKTHLDGLVGHMLMRHPVYVRRYPESLVELSELEWAVIVLAVAGCAKNEMASLMGISPTLVDGAVQRLASYDILRSVAVSQDTLALQRFHANQLPPTAGEFMDFSENGEIGGPDGFMIEKGQFADLVSLCIAALTERGVGPGTRLSLTARAHPLILGCALAALSLGCEVDLTGSKQADIAIVDAVAADLDSRRQIAMGWEGESDSLIARLEQVEPLPIPSFSDDACVWVHAGSTVLSLPALTLWQTAGSFRHLIGRVDRHGAINSVSGLLAALVALQRGDPLNLNE